MTHDIARRIRRTGLRRTTRGFATMALGVALLGCGSGPTSAPSVALPSVAPTASAAASIAATASPTEAGPAEPCSEPGCAMAAGEYHASRIAGGMTFRLVGDGWTNVAYVPEILSLRSTNDWVAFMFDELRIEQDDAFKMTTDPEVAQRLIAKLPGIKVTPIDDPIEIDGRDALVFDIANTGTETMVLLGLGDTSGMYSLDPEASVRMHWIDIDGTPFILALEAPTASFEAFLAEAQPILDSIAFD